MSFTDQLINQNEPFSIIDEVDQNTTYLGYTQAGVSSTTEAKFKIVKIEKIGTITTKKFADGDQLYNNIWNDRLTLTYSFLL